ncbi:carbon-nitrogen hydrolase family protein [Candidatus Leptofilum sp.]|uniref:carbon-nitrogen hydrolase family protein n=1 Tax=Candidatus Leptofilum sp. TaxID=3241576 RepID=UPI003B5BD24F
MSDTVTIGSYQGPIVDGDVAANLSVILHQLEKPEHSGLDFFCFPETYLTGYSPKAITECAVSRSSALIQKLVVATKKHKTVLLVGFAEKTEQGIYNSQIVIHRGEILGIAHKTMLTPSYDDRYFITDLSLPLFTAHGIKFGVAICHTTSFVEPALYLRWRGARLLFTPHFNNIGPCTEAEDGGRLTFWAHRQMVLNNQSALATLLKMVVVRSNVIVVRPDALGAGDSNIWGMDGELVAAGEPFTEQVVTATFDKKIFTEEHWIDRREVPPQLLHMIAEAAQNYGQ